MNSIKTSVLTVFWLISITASGQDYEPLELAKKIFGKDKFENIDHYSMGEYKGEPNGQDIPKGSTTKFELLDQNEKTAVVGLTILDPTGKGLDTYLHFEKDTTWKMQAFRALAMTGIIEQVVQELEKMTDKQINAIIKQSKDKNNSHGLFTSRDEYDFNLGNSKLTLEIDDNIKKHFLKNQSEFERIKDLALKQLETEKADEEFSTRLVENIKQDYRKLFIFSVSTGGYQLGNVINFLIGGMVDNTVGYIYVKDKKDIPEMSPNRIIMIKEIGNGWYIYKTT